MINKCNRHGLQWNFDDECPHCARDKYESEFRAEVYKNAEEKYIKYIKELLTTINAQEKILDDKQKIICELMEALNKVKEEWEFINAPSKDGWDDLLITVKQAITKAQEEI